MQFTDAEAACRKLNYESAVISPNQAFDNQLYFPQTVHPSLVSHDIATSLLLRCVALEKSELLGVDGSFSLLSDQIDCIRIAGSQFHQSDGNQDGGSE